mgnify:CR=1 FL=1
MGSALPLGDPAPLDGALPDDIAIDAQRDLGVYLHVPFCRVRCGYCDFNTYTATELRGARQDAYADEVLREIALSQDALAARGALRPAQTVFFGGGTPTLLPGGDLARMLGGIRDTFALAPDAEVTVEANPQAAPCVVLDLAGEDQVQGERQGAADPSPPTPLVEPPDGAHLWPPPRVALDVGERRDDRVPRSVEHPLVVEDEARPGHLPILLPSVGRGASASEPRDQPAGTSTTLAPCATTPATD